MIIGHFGPRQIITFWALYGMLFYAMAGPVVRLCIHRDRRLPPAALTLIGYYTIGAPFLLWMAVVHGGGLSAEAASGCVGSETMAGLDEVIHQPLRLRIMAALNALPVSIRPWIFPG